MLQLRASCHYFAACSIITGHFVGAQPCACRCFLGGSLRLADVRFGRSTHLVDRRGMHLPFSALDTVHAAPGRSIRVQGEAPTSACNAPLRPLHPTPLGARCSTRPLRLQFQQPRTSGLANFGCCFGTMEPPAQLKAANVTCSTACTLTRASVLRRVSPGFPFTAC